ncbi:MULTISPECIES: DUF3373 family protein [Sulfurimonas]|uniref:DUF3373 family protein n=1 Tax=Sulfurimonas TaxID=202746 RepID=UPI0012641521|nr:DUF3373 family protein [Sulfurimonas indica]
MKKILLSLAVIGGLASSTFADDIADLKAEIDALNKKVAKLENQQKRTKKSLAKVRAHDAFDNIKFDIDFRTAYDYISYKTATKTYTNDALFSNRLWLGMGYQPTKDMIFKGQLAFNKAFGADTNGRGQGYDGFDWVINETLTDDTLKVREAYWLWTPTVGGFGTTLSVGRRPATNGYLINLRDDDKAKSPQGHIINMEFDGLSASIKLDKYVSGSYLKLCLGRGLTNARTRFDAQGLDYATDTSADKLDNMDLVGVLAKIYDDGQYSAMATYYRGFNVPGIDSTLTTPALRTFGNMDGAALSAQIQGIGDMINDFLDDTILFASVAWSQTIPNANQPMLGSINKESGYSYWIGAQVPNLTGGKFGLEYNHGSKYWRPFTYGEDTMIGSKMATRGNAYEAYWTQPIIKKDGKSLFSMQIRYTYLDYDYTGSNGFFGDNGTPLTMAEAVANGLDPVESAQDLRVYFRYRY